MANHDDESHEEINRLRGLVVKLSREVDFKNHLLMQKEDLSLEKFATLSCLVEEKDRLLTERSEVIGELMAQNYRLNQAYIKGIKDSEDVKLELEKVKHDSEVEKLKKHNSTCAIVEYQAEANKKLEASETTCLSTQDKVNEQSAAMTAMKEDKEMLLKRLKDAKVQLGEKDKLLTEKYATIGKLMASVADKDKLLGKASASVSKLTTEKRGLLETCKAGKRDVESMKKQSEKSPFKVEQHKQIQEQKGDRSMVIKTETMDYDFGASESSMEPLWKKCKETKPSQNCRK